MRHTLRQVRNEMRRATHLCGPSNLWQPPPGGFTLIELSIVLVIIALLIGGVMAGASLTRAAQIQSFISQLGQYQAAVGTFQSKYSYLPGDLTPAQATKYNFAARAGSLGHGNGDGIVSGDSGGLQNGEAILFWNDLAKAGLTPGNTATTDCGWATGPLCPAISDPSTELPKANLGGQGSFIVVVGSVTQKKSYFHVQGDITSMDAYGEAGCNVTNTMCGAFSPTEAQAIDQKMDDGLPMTGSVQAHWSALTFYTAPPDDGFTYSAAPGTSLCTSAAAGNPYITGSNITSACTLDFEFTN